MVKKIWNNLKLLISLIISWWLLSLFNFFDYFNNMSMGIKEKAGLAFYTLILQTTFLWIEELITKKCVLKIEGLFSHDKKGFNLSNSPIIVLPDNEVDHVKVHLKIKLSGSCKILKDVKLKIFFPEWVDTNIEADSRYASLDSDRCCTIYLKNLIQHEQCENINLEYPITFAFLRATQDSGFSLDIEVKKENVNLYQKFILDFETNKFTLKG